MNTHNPLGRAVAAYWARFDAECDMASDIGCEIVLPREDHGRPLDKISKLVQDTACETVLMETEEERDAWLTARWEDFLEKEKQHASL